VFIKNWKRRKYFIDIKKKRVTYYDPVSEKEKGYISFDNLVRLETGDIGWISGSCKLISVILIL